jgi:hypothetical protein
VTGKQLFCAAISAQLSVACLFAVYRGEWRDAVVILAGAMVNGAMAVPT